MWKTWTIQNKMSIYTRRIKDDDDDGSICALRSICRLTATLARRYSKIVNIRTSGHHSHIRKSIKINIYEIERRCASLMACGAFLRRQCFLFFLIASPWLLYFMCSDRQSCKAHARACSCYWFGRIIRERPRRYNVRRGKFSVKRMGL